MGKGGGKGWFLASDTGVMKVFPAGFCPLLQIAIFVLSIIGNWGRVNWGGGRGISDGHVFLAKAEKGRVELEVFVPYSNFLASVNVHIINSKGVSFVILPNSFS